MSLEYAILGFLNYGPLSGYDLKKVFDNSVQHFWPADQSQIYRTLSRLTKKDLVTIELVTQSERPDRKLYHITESGKSELLDWLAKPTPESVARSAELVQVFFFGQLDDDLILQRFETFAQNIHMVSERYSQLSEEFSNNLSKTCTPRELFFWMLTLDYGVRTMRENLAWVEDTIQKIKTGQVPAK